MKSNEIEQVFVDYQYRKGARAILQSYTSPHPEEIHPYIHLSLPIHLQHHGATSVLTCYFAICLFAFALVGRTTLASSFSSVHLRRSWGNVLMFISSNFSTLCKSGQQKSKMLVVFFEKRVPIFRFQINKISCKEFQEIHIFADFLFWRTMQEVLQFHYEWL